MKHINLALTSILRYFTTFLFMVMLFIVFMQVILRYFVGASISGSEEAARYILFFLVLLGASICVFEQSHLSIEYFRDKLRGWMSKVASLVISISIIISAAIFVYYGWELSMRSMTQTTPSLQIPRGWVFMAFPVAGALMLFFQLQHLVAIWRKG